MARPALSDDAIRRYRERAVSVATRLFAERGYAGVTLRAIAAELGDSPMTPYRYFENKAEIFALVRAQAFRRFADGQERAFASTSDPLGRLWAMREAYFDAALAEPDAYRVMFELAQEPQDRYPELAEQAGRAFSYTLRAVEEGIACGLMEGDPLTVAHQLWAQVHGLISLHLAGKLTLGRSLEDLRRLPGNVVMR